MGEKVGSAALDETGEDYNTAPEPRAVVPWLVKEYREFNEKDYRQTKELYGFYDIFGENNENCTEFETELSNTTFYQKPSHQGWLIVICSDEKYNYSPGRKYRDCFLWNPMTKEKIQLPRLPKFYKGLYRLNSDCVLTSPPHTKTNINLDNDNSNDSMVLLFCYHSFPDETDHTFLFCRPGETQWRIRKLSPDLVDFISGRSSHTVLCFKGKLYLMCSDDDDDQIDEQFDHHLEIDHFSKGTKLTISIKALLVKKVFLPLLGNAYSVSYYLESHDELFRVDIIYRRGCGGDVISIAVVKLNFSSMEWEKVNSLGDLVLFLGVHTTAFSSASELGFKRGCLYYCVRCERGLYKFEIQSTGNIVTFPSEPFSCTDWVIMPVNEQRRVAYMLASNEEKNGALETKTSSMMVVNDESQGGKGSAQKVEVVSYWNKFNKDTLGMIANHLHGLDYKHFRSTCKGNREMIPKVQTTSFLSPWLVFSRDHRHTIFSYVNPMYHDENYSINISDLAECIIRFQKGGWLLMTKENIIFFYNPFTRDMVILPDMDRAYCHSVVSFSSLPISSDCIVFAMDERHDQVFIDFIKKGEAQWSSCVLNNTHGEAPFLDTAIFHDGDFFCVDLHGAVGVFSPNDKSWKIIKEPRWQYFADSPGFLVECGRNILLVKLECDDLHEDDEETYDDWDGLKSVRILRLNISEMEWVKVENLGEHVLFLSNTSCVSAVAPNSNMKKNIYFPRLHLNDGGIVFYSLETRSYHSTGIQHSANNLSDTEGWFWNCTWIEPNRLISTVEELDWLKTPFRSK